MTHQLPPPLSHDKDKLQNLQRFANCRAAFHPESDPTAKNQQEPISQTQRSIRKFTYPKCTISQCPSIGIFCRLARSIQYLTRQGQHQRQQKSTRPNISNKTAIRNFTYSNNNSHRPCPQSAYLTDSTLSQTAHQSSTSFIEHNALEARRWVDMQR
jgi:hypothetical protein